ncbi:LOW QUALITY PROTEIN: uncharacterized protein [Watersipora subatra]|uniref:LOW QUALITY PROTEIN: uncharacterized protein n=1 Tax=Watersipora subatra TaxID=2589382 RepID=UPI00355ACE99
MSCNPMYADIYAGKTYTNDTNQQSRNLKKTYATQHNGPTQDIKGEISAKECVYCNMKNHSTAECGKFGRLSFNEQQTFMRDKQLCFSCLTDAHSYRQCEVPAICKVCQGKHPTALHNMRTSSVKQQIKSGFGNSSNLEQSKPITNSSLQPKAAEPLKTKDNSQWLEKSCLNTCLNMELNSLSWILPVWVSSKNNPLKEALVYALVDSMSDTTYITVDTIHKIQPDYTHTEIDITTMTSDKKKVHTHLVYGLTVRAYNHKVCYELLPSYSHHKIPIDRRQIPTKTVLSRWPHLIQVVNELPNNHKDVPVGLLIGNNFTKAFKPQQVIDTDHDDEPFAIKTAIGWNVMGDSAPHTTLATIVDQPAKHDFVTFQCTTKSNKEVHKLKYIQPRISWFRLLEKKFQKDSHYKEQYHEFMRDIINKGEAIPATEETTDHSWYIPHFGVYHPRKPDRIRVVFDCAAKVGGVSLNDFLLQGPEHMNDLQGILLRFRLRPIAIMGDIERMFHQFKVSENHQDYLRFIWYNAEGQLQSYKMTVHLFGARSSPACATYGLRFLADNFRDAIPHNTQSHHFIHHNFYVDDGLASVRNESEAVNLIKKSQALCQTGKLRLHKIASNSRAVLAAIPKSECTSILVSLELTSEPLPQERSLGVLWDTNQDIFTFKHEPPSKPNTRRGVLSSVASVFDPLGLISPFTLKGRIILQETCKQNYDWDTPLESSLLNCWAKWMSDLSNVHNVQVPRCVSPRAFNQIESAQLHTFTDASTTGYGHCTYLRLVNTNRKVHVALLASKAKVAPIKQITIPRLELQAACSAVQAVNKYVKKLELPNITTYFYSDSTVVLGYICNTKERFQTFVANRVETIRTLSKPKNWAYVPTNQNPADMASRGASIIDLTHSEWFSGPKFLWTEPIDIPPQPQLSISPNDDEVKKASISLMTTAKIVVFDKYLERFSKWNSAIKAIVLIRKVIYKEAEPNYETAKHAILRIIQHDYFSDEIADLNEYKSVKKSSSLMKLAPFVDENGLLRIGGRLQESSTLSFHEKHPIIIPKASHIAKLVISHYHQLAAHQGCGPTLASIQTHGFWIVNARSQVYKQVKSCVICKKIRGTPKIPQMATLPSKRLDETAPFTHCGLDCFGTFRVKDGRKERKTYGLIITCLSSRAVHIELLEDMTSDSFINALRNLIAIRGAVSTIRCDQGTNFVGAFNDLARNMQGQITHHYSDIKFTFNPPHSSNMGGVWERLIRSARNILKGMGEKHEEQTPLTPNILLTMKSQLTLPPPGVFEKADIYSKKRWRVVQQLANEFWRRWRNEYIHTLQTRQKWTHKQDEVLVGDVVHVLKDEGLRGDWSLARVVDIERSHDGEFGAYVRQQLKRGGLPPNASYDDETMSTMLRLFIKRPDAYKNLRESKIIGVVPAESTLIQHKNQIKQIPGINIDLLAWLRGEANKRGLAGVGGGLAVDEMSIQKKLEVAYDGSGRGLHEFIGFEELDPVITDLRDEKDSVLAKHVLQFYFNGYSGFKLLVCHYPVKAYTAKELNHLIQDVVYHQHVYNFNRWSSETEVSIARRLTDDHLFLTTSLKIKNDSAEAMLDRDMLNSFKMYRRTLSESTKVDGLIELLEVTCDLVEVFNDQKPVSSLVDPRMKTILRALDYFKPFLDAKRYESFTAESTWDMVNCLTTIVELTRRVTSKKGTLIIGLINSDVMENHFCNVRTLCNGANKNPTSYQVLVLIILSNTMAYNSTTMITVMPGWSVHSLHWVRREPWGEKTPKTEEKLECIIADVCQGRAPIVSGQTVLKRGLVINIYQQPMFVNLYCS